MNVIRVRQTVQHAQVESLHTQMACATVSKTYYSSSDGN